ncbi:MAG: hypothetical protein M3066_03180, partial [Actinomycetota bacterium]|nr:hypothetical protein [Actinomycetota bacterium]
MDLLAERLASGQAGGPKLGARKHQVVIGLDDHQLSEDTLQAATSDLAPSRLDGAKAHLRDGHEGHDDRATVDDGPISGRSAGITTGVDESA